MGVETRTAAVGRALKLLPRLLYRI